MRATEIIEFITADEMPGVEESRHYYTHIDAVSSFSRAKLRRLRRKHRNEMVQLSTGGTEDVPED